LRQILPDRCQTDNKPDDRENPQMAQRDLQREKRAGNFRGLTGRITL
jgi:hypothetical protein